MSDDEVKAPTHEELKELEEKRLANAEPFDPTKHGVGTAPVNQPQSVAQLWPIVVALQKRVDFLERKLKIS